jgi:hypothetical protein
MAKRSLVFGLVLGLATTVGGVAEAIPEEPEQGRINSADDTNDPEQQHGTLEGHLPPDVHNVELIGKLRLTDKVDGIADVGYFKGFAYLSAWGPNCPGGGGVHVVDVRDPANPKKVGFLPAGPNEYPGEGIHVMAVDTPFFKGDLLLHNNEFCNSAAPAVGGMSMWDVTNPLAPKKIGQFGDSAPAIFDQPATYHDIHSVQGFTQPGKAFAVMVDNDENVTPPFKDVDIADITNPAAPKMAVEQGLEDWPGAQGSYANGDTVFHHDMQFKRIGGHDFLAVSYWDAGQVLLNVDDPYNPKFVGDSDFPSPDPETGFQQAEGNSHESYWSSNNRYLLSSDEDFAPFRTLFRIETGPNAGIFAAGEFGWTEPVDLQPNGEINGPTIFGGRGCVAAGPNAPPPGVDFTGDPAPPPASTVAAGPGEEKTIVFSRGGCFFSTKVAAGQDLGYDVVIIGQSHGGTRNGLLPDAHFCGGQGHDYDEQIPGICIGHRAMHLMFNDPPAYSGAEGADIPMGALGEDYRATTEFDGWGYVNLHDATNPNLPIIDTYALLEQLDDRYASRFGDLSVHEVKTDPRPGVNLAYFSWYAAGMRVAEFDDGTITEVGKFIDQGGNNFWGVFPIGDETAGHGYPGLRPSSNPLVLMSDRDFGLYILRYTGSIGKCRRADATAVGTDERDVLVGTKGEDVILGLGGKDVIRGLGARDTLCGGGGSDRIRGGAHNDWVTGQGGGDKLYGQSGKDRLKGKKGRDFCDGGSSRDLAKCERELRIP